MKTLLFTTALLLSSNAHASWFQTNCSNGEATTKWAHGHDQSSLSVTAKPDGLEKVVMDIDLNSVHIRESTPTTIHESFTNSCREGDKIGYTTRTRVEAIEILIGRVDGTLWLTYIDGVSKDHSTVRAFLICETKSTSQIRCQ